MRLIMDAIAVGTEPFFIDVMKKGEQLSAVDVRRRFPGTDVVRPRLDCCMRDPACSSLPHMCGSNLLLQHGSHALFAVQEELLKDPKPLQLWAELVRTVVVALQRRGESDGVANLLYQLLALDTAASEWHQVLNLP